MNDQYEAAAIGPHNSIQKKNMTYFFKTDFFFFFFSKTIFLQKCFKKALIIIIRRKMYLMVRNMRIVTKHKNTKNVSCVCIKHACHKCNQRKTLQNILRHSACNVHTASHVS